MSNMRWKVKKQIDFDIPTFEKIRMYINIDPLSPGVCFPDPTFLLSDPNFRGKLESASSSCVSGSGSYRFPFQGLEQR